MKKKILTIALTGLLYLSAVALGISTVFRVDSVFVEATVVSLDGKTQVQEIQEKLQDIYNRQSAFSLNIKDAERVIKDYPYFRITEFKKTYPDALCVELVEDSETYAIEAEGGYYIVSGEGVFVEFRDTPTNRLDQADNVLVQGLELTGSREEGLQGDDCWDSLLALCQGMDKSLGGIRKNVHSVQVLTRSTEIFYCVTMREGIKIYVNDPSTLTEAKVEKAVAEYLMLTDAQRMTGCITVHVIENEAYAQYLPKYEFDF